MAVLGCLYAKYCDLISMATVFGLNIYMSYLYLTGRRFSIKAPRFWTLLFRYARIAAIKALDLSEMAMRDVGIWIWLFAVEPRF